MRYVTMQASEKLEHGDLVAVEDGKVRKAVLSDMTAASVIVRQAKCNAEIGEEVEYATPFHIYHA